MVYVFTFLAILFSWSVCFLFSVCLDIVSLLFIHVRTPNDVTRYRLAAMQFLEILGNIFWIFYLDISDTILAFENNIKH